MKRIFAAIMVFALLLTTQMSTFALGRNEPTNYNFIAPKASKPPVLDGKVGIAEWKGVKKFTLDKNNGHNWTSTEMNLSIDYYFMWDEKNLYGAAVIRGDVTTAYSRPGQLAMQNYGDALQISLYPDYKITNKTPVWYTIGIQENNTLTAYQHNYGEKILSDVKGKVTEYKDDTKQYTMEFCIPWSTISGAKVNGKEEKMPTFKAKQGMQMRMIVAMLEGDYIGYNTLKSGGKSFEVKDYDKLTLSGYAK